MAGHTPWSEVRDRREPRETIPPVHKPWKRSQCIWVTGIGWVKRPADGSPVT